MHREWVSKFICSRERHTSYTASLPSFVIRIITLFREKVMEAAGWAKKCVEEPSSQVFSVSK